MANDRILHHSIDTKLDSYLFDLVPLWTEQISDSWINQCNVELDKALFDCCGGIADNFFKRPQMIQEISDIYIKRKAVEACIEKADNDNELKNLNAQLTSLIRLMTEKFRLVKKADADFKEYMSVSLSLMNTFGAEMNFDNSLSSRQEHFNKYISTCTMGCMKPMGYSKSEDFHRFKSQNLPGQEFVIKSNTQFAKGSKVCLFVEIGCGGLAALIKNGKLIDSDTTRSLIKKMVKYFIGYKTTLGILSDVDTSILINYDDSYLVNNTLKIVKQVPFKYRVFGMNEPNFTLQRLVTSTIYYQGNLSDQAKAKQETASNKLFHLVYDPFASFSKVIWQGQNVFNKVCPSLIGFKGARNDYTILQSAGRDHLTQIFKFSRQSFEKCFPDIKLIKGNTDIIIKLYDLPALKDYYFLHNKTISESIEVFRDNFLRRFKVEYQSLNRIKLYNRNRKEKIRAPEIFDHGEMLFTVYGPEPTSLPFSFHGFFIMMSYIDHEKDQEMTDSLIDQQTKQKELLRSIGITHDTVHPQVLIRNSHVNLINFSHANFPKATSSQSVGK